MGCGAGGRSGAKGKATQSRGCLCHPQSKGHLSLSGGEKLFLCREGLSKGWDGGWGSLEGDLSPPKAPATGTPWVVPRETLLEPKQSKKYQQGELPTPAQEWGRASCSLKPLHAAERGKQSQAWVLPAQMGL